jgi:23S rRNA (uracil1939-C5)-methyltransferase
MTIQEIADRVEAPCEVLHDCGACTLQEMDYCAQLVLKKSTLDKLAASLTDEKLETHFSGLDLPFGYRTRLLMPASSTDGSLRFGFYRRQSLALVAAEGCPVQHPATLKALESLREDLTTVGVEASDVEGGWLHAVAIRCDPKDGRWDLVLMVNKTRPALAKKLSALPGLLSVSQIIYRKRSSYPFSGVPEEVWSKERLSLELAGQRFEISPGSFFQTSLSGAELLADAVLELSPEKVGKLADLYGGVGVFSRLLASRWNEALLIEASASSIADLSAANVPNLRYLAGAVEDNLAALDSFQPDLVIVDPPRKGLKPAVVKKLVSFRAERIIYIACGIQAFERDARLLVDGGYRLLELRGVDMFPHTQHLEIVALFECP